MSGATALPDRLAVPPAARDLMLSCVDAGWDTLITQRVDTGGSPYVNVTARSEDPDGHIDATWHTRATGTYRLFHCLVGRSRGSVRDAPLKAAKALVAGESTYPA